MVTIRPLFSVIVHTYDRPKLLAQALASIQAQTIAEFECILVDDAGSVPVVVPDDLRFRSIRREENGGPGASLNTGIHAARGKYLAFLDDDDLFCVDRLAIALEGFRRAPVAICLGTTFGDVTRRRSRASWSRRLAYGPSRPPLRGDVGGSIREGMTPNIGQAAVVRSQVVLFDESLRASPDVDWWIRQALRARVWTVERIGFCYRIHHGPRHNNGMRCRVAALTRILEKHQYYFERNRRAKAFHLLRIGVSARTADMPGKAMRAFSHSFLLRPSFASAYYLANSVSASGRRAASEALSDAD